jgi:hypothetical protein
MVFQQPFAKLTDCRNIGVIALSVTFGNQKVTDNILISIALCAKLPSYHFYEGKVQNQKKSRINQTQNLSSFFW